MALNIIGGSGFIGTRLVNRLISNGHLNVAIIDKERSKAFTDLWSFGDVRLIESLRKSIQKKSTIVHLAAEHRDDVRPLSLYKEVNVDGAKNICRVASEGDIKTIIFTSTVAVYGFALVGADESAKIKPFNQYGATKYEAENIFRDWQAEEPDLRTLVIVRPTVVFGERNRGNVFNLLRQIAFGRFIMIGNGLNRKSLAYVENIAAFIEFSLNFPPGTHIFNYVDKPDYSMNALVDYVSGLLGRSPLSRLRLPIIFGLCVGYGFDFLAKVTKKKFPISAIRVKKFCANSVYGSGIDVTGFTPPVPLSEAIKKTVIFEFVEDHKAEELFYSE
jgi:nucleoside-diphosphate-sugar epimerase